MICHVYNDSSPIRLAWVRRRPGQHNQRAIKTYVTFQGI